MKRTATLAMSFRFLVPSAVLFASVLVPVAGCSSPPSERVSSTAAAITGETSDLAIASECQLPVNVTTHGGGSMTSPTVMLVPVFWGPSVTSTTAAAMESFYGILSDSATPYLSWLRTEYGAPPVEAASAITIYPQDLPTTSPQRVTDFQFQKELSIQMQPGGAIPYNQNAIYVIHLPQNVTAIDPSGDVQCTKWGAYHWWYNGPYGVVHYAIIPDYSSSPGSCSTFSFGSLTAVESHEIAESLTDPDGNTGWRDSSQPTTCGGGEIGDLCAQIESTILDPYGNSVWVQKLWSNLAQDCVTGDVLPTISNMTPAYGPNVGGTVVQVTGERFAVGTNTTIFSFGGANAPSSNCSSSTSCTVTTPPFLAPKANVVQVTATVGTNTSAWDGNQDNFEFTAGASCTSSLSCAGITFGFPNVVLTCASTANFSVGSSPGETSLGSGTTVTYRTDNVAGTLWACDPTRGSCTPFSTFEQNPNYCGQPTQPPNFCQNCVKAGGHCATEGSTHVCILE
jgi:hypothetical protein